MPLTHDTQDILSFADLPRHSLVTLLQQRLLALKDLSRLAVHCVHNVLHLLNFGVRNVVEDPPAELSRAEVHI